jgi:hypothetical protein
MLRYNIIRYIIFVPYVTFQNILRVRGYFLYYEYLRGAIISDILSLSKAIGPFSKNKSVCFKLPNKQTIICLARGMKIQASTYRPSTVLSDYPSVNVRRQMNVKLVTAFNNSFFVYSCAVDLSGL